MGGPVWVTAVNLVIWTGLVLWLLRLDRRIRELEREP
ncbi:MAG TPA: CcmD family protein [Thermoanaerobaculia bacterium]|nr:CcmD family protein [Thermoanaerobaculia bacterium]